MNSPAASRVERVTVRAMPKLGVIPCQRPASNDPPEPGVRRVSTIAGSANSVKVEAPDHSEPAKATPPPTWSDQRLAAGGRGVSAAGASADGRMTIRTALISPPRVRDVLLEVDRTVEHSQDADLVRRLPDYTIR